MSKIVITLENVAETSKAAFFVHKVVGTSLGKVRHQLQTGAPIAEYILFYNDHDEVAAKLRKLVEELPQYGLGRFYELAENEESSGLVLSDPRELAPGTVLTILDQHDREIERQSNIQ